MLSQKPWPDGLALAFCCSGRAKSCCRLSPLARLGLAYFGSARLGSQCYEPLVGSLILFYYPCYDSLFLFFILSHPVSISFIPIPLITDHYMYIKP